MVEVLDDVKKTLDLVCGKEYENYGNIYFSSNEDLNALFSNFSVKDKDVLCVLASSDQLFYSYLNGARSVDSFDINKLTFYYYYLRKWVIEYLNKYYPNEKITNEYIFNLLKLVRVNSYDEEKAYNYWDSYIKTIYGYLNKKLFFMNSLINTNRIDDVSKLKEILKNIELNFMNIDISDEIETNKKYDVIITSNLSEYFYDNVLKINRYKNNLGEMLKDDGIIVSSHIFNICGNSTEKRIFGKEYDIHEFPYAKDVLGYYPVGNSYKRRVLTKKC